MTLPYSQLRSFRPSLEPRLPLPGPLTCHLETTNFCNLKCPTCPQSIPGWVDSVGGRMAMPRPTSERVVKSMAQAGLKVLRLYQTNEPLLDICLDDRIRHASNLKIRTEVTTNGYALNEAKAQILIDSGLDYLRISFYETTPISVVENVKRLFKMRGTKKKPFIYVKAWAQIELLREELGEYCDELCDEKGLLHTWAGTFPQLAGDNAKLNLPRKVCPSPFYVIKISTNGDVWPCCLHPVPSDMKCNLLGNIYEQDILNIWNGEKAKALRRQMLEGKRGENPVCSKCDFIHQHPDDLDSTTRPIEEMI
jgi:radical SAM protein with 4Fe4S-binding SPASM domain